MADHILHCKGRGGIPNYYRVPGIPIIIVNARQLRRILLEYKDYYNHDRTHLSLGKDPPVHRSIERSGKLKSRKILGGLHHRYYRDERE